MLVFLGGVIILIIYIRTLAANEKFIILETSNLFLVIIRGLVIRLILPSAYNYLMKSSPNINIVINLYEYANSRLSMFLILYLLITIVCVVKLVKFEKGPLVGRL